MEMARYSSQLGPSTMESSKMGRCTDREICTWRTGIPTQGTFNRASTMVLDVMSTSRTIPCSKVSGDMV